MEAITDEQLGQAIERARLARSLTQEGLSTRLIAAGLNWSRVTLSKVESGQRPVKVTELPLVLGALGLSLNEMLGLSEDPLRRQMFAAGRRAERAVARLDGVVEIAGVVEGKRRTMEGEVARERRLHTLFAFLVEVRDSPDRLRSVNWPRDLVLEALENAVSACEVGAGLLEAVAVGLPHVKFGTDPDARAFDYVLNGDSS